MKKKIEKLNTRIEKLIEKIGPRKKVKDTKRNRKLKKELNTLLIKVSKLLEKDLIAEMNKVVE